MLMLYGTPGMDHPGVCVLGMVKVGFRNIALLPGFGEGRAHVYRCRVHGGAKHYFACTRCFGWAGPQQRSQTIRFRTAAEMLENFGMHTGGKEYRRLIAAFERIFGTTIFFGTDTFSNRATIVQRSRFNFMREAQIWYSRGHPDQRTLSSDFENVIVASDEFYQELISHPVPNDLEAVKVLAASPAVLDLFMWLSYRCFTAKGTQSIPLFGDFGLANQIGTMEYSRPRRFRAMLEQWLDSIRVLWPECPARLTSDGQAIVLRHAAAVVAGSAPALNVNRAVERT